METERVRKGRRRQREKVSDDTTVGTHTRHSGSEVSQRVAAAGGEEGWCRVEPRGFWVDKSVVDQEERPKGERQGRGKEVREGAIG